jgi:hypothetical protein
MKLELRHVDVHDFPILLFDCHVTGFWRRHGHAVAFAEHLEPPKLFRWQQANHRVVPERNGATSGLRGSTGGAGGALSVEVKARLAALTVFDGLLY